MEIIYGTMTSRVAFYAWISSLDKILTWATFYNLQKRHIVLMEKEKGAFNGWLVLCVQESVESMNHLLFHCEIAGALWSDFFRWVEEGLMAAFIS